MIRRAIPADADALLALERSVPEAARWSAAEYASPASDDQAALQRWIFIAEDDIAEEKAPLGFIVVKLLRVGEAVEAEIENLAVSLQARRRGVGLALCTTALEACGAAGAHTVELEVRAGNQAAIGLYRRLGFEQTGLRTAYYANPKEDAVLLRISLPNQQKAPR